MTLKNIKTSSLREIGLLLCKEISKEENLKLSVEEKIFRKALTQQTIKLIKRIKNRTDFNTKDRISLKINHTEAFILYNLCVKYPTEYFCYQIFEQIHQNNT